MERDIILPFEELEPCCQKEIMQRKREAEIRKELKQYDRIDTKKHAKDNVFSLGDWSCDCCSHSADYPLLQQMRSQFQPPPNEDVNDSESVDSSDEEDFLDDFISASQQEALDAMRVAAAKLETAQKRGFGILVEDSAQHLLSLILDQPHPLLIHLYDPSSATCAIVDLALEQLSQRYLGTKCRRLRYYGAALLIDTLQLNTSGPCIICVRENVTVHVEKELSVKCVGEDVNATARELERILDNTHVLQHDAIAHKHQQTNNDSDEEEPNRYCDMKGCTRNFIHSHVGAQEDGGNALTLQENNIYDKDHFMRY